MEVSQRADGNRLTSSCGSVFPIFGSDLTTYAPPSPPLVNLTPMGFASVTWTCADDQLKNFVVWKDENKAVSDKPKLEQSPTS